MKQNDKIWDYLFIACSGLSSALYLDIGNYAASLWAFAAMIAMIRHLVLGKLDSTDGSELSDETKND